MFKSKKDPLEDDDFGQNNDLNPTYDDPDSTQKKKRSGCLIAIIVVFTLVIGGVLIHAVRGGSTSLVSQSELTLTVSADDGAPAQVAEGLIVASYS